ncbi:STAS/SEC14 domain-containing protein [Rufibacter roseus]|uniref:STAS/SEC14 domain-containing protein n=1 Tax=Rufibacter roseus TaxID=1567108 RepID=A0ABW2DM65_9BACT|nr:STAS/SEC14 domain-containing protein [Rufibacter roseus]
MTQELRNIFDKVFLTITEDHENRWVFVDWSGYLTEENIKAGALAYTKVIKDTGFSCVLNDTTKVVGSWDHSLDWVVNEWSVQAAAAGVRHFAMVTAPETFAQTSAENFYSNVKAFKINVFDNLEEASRWLRKYSLHNGSSLI